MRIRTMLLTVLLTVLAYTGVNYVDTLRQPERSLPRKTQPAETLPKELRFVLLGVDKRPTDPGERADTIILVSMNQEAKLITALSIPRDTKVATGPNRFGRINTLFTKGGPDQIAEAVARIVGVGIDRYVETDFEGFKRIVDILGGVTVDVEKDMYYADDVGLINLKKGTQHLNGAQALQYARFRHDKLGDIGRTGRQLKLIKALAKEAASFKQVTNYPQLAKEVNRSVETNLTARDKLLVVAVAQNFKDYQVITQTLPGKFSDEAGASYWSVDPDQARQTYEKLQQGQGNQKIILP